MRKATLKRVEQTSEAMFGNLIVGSEVKWVTLELPWRENEHDNSCVPEGIYVCAFQSTPRHPNGIYILQNVPNRTMIEIHSANVPSELLGCIAPGLEFGEVLGQRGVLFSLAALTQLEQEFEQNPFVLTIVNGFELPPYDFS